MSLSGSRKKRGPPQTGELLERWKSGDAEAEAELLKAGPAAVIPLLRTSDEIEYLRGPIPQSASTVIIACATVALNIFVIPFALVLGFMFSFRPILIWTVLLGAESAMLIWAWRNRERLREAAERFALKQTAEALVAGESLDLFQDPQWDDAILDGLLLKQSDGPDLVRPPAHPIYPSVVRVLSRIDAEGARVLLPKHLDALTKFLNNSYFEQHEKLIYLILDVIARFGDHRYLRKVRPLAMQGAFDAVGTRVKSAAQKCVAHMESRLENEKRARVLLRPSRSETPESDTLLHPAESENVNCTQLLRATEEAAES